MVFNCHINFEWFFSSNPSCKALDHVIAPLAHSLPPRFHFLRCTSLYATWVNWFLMHQNSHFAVGRCFSKRGRPLIPTCIISSTWQLLERQISGLTCWMEVLGEGWGPHLAFTRSSRGFWCTWSSKTNDLKRNWTLPLKIPKLETPLQLLHLFSHPFAPSTNIHWVSVMN